MTAAGNPPGAADVTTGMAVLTLLQELGPDGPAGRTVLEEAEDQLAVFRERDTAREEGDDILRTHDVVVVEDFGGGTGWHLRAWTSCAPQRVLEGLGSAEVWLAAPPDPASGVDLLVMELACSSGEDAEGRIEVVEQAEGTSAVELLVAVRPDGGGDCPSNPATPFTVTLDQPLGDRTVIDTSVYPPRPLDVAPAELWTGD